MMVRKIVYIAILAVVIIGGYFVWQKLNHPSVPPGFAVGNGRLEATEIDIASKFAGRVTEIDAKEGDTVDAGQIIARIDPEALDAQLRQAEARIRESRDAEQSALANVAEKKSDYDFKAKQYARTKQLFAQRVVPEQNLDRDLGARDAAKASWVSAQAQATQAHNSVDAVIAESDRLKADIKESVLRAPIRGRIQYRLAELGEVLPSGGKVYTLIDLADVYMYIFLPEADSGKLAIGDEGRIVLDAVPEYPIIAKVSFLSAKAQFTPKTVETAEERHKLTFRVKLQLNRERLRQFEPLVKVGLPGVGYVRIDQSAQWPEMLQPKPIDPSKLPWQPVQPASTQ
jgi:HlyD family secretion protein